MARRGKGSFRIVSDKFNMREGSYMRMLGDIVKESNHVGELYEKQVGKVVNNWSKRSKPSFYHKSRIFGAKVELRVFVKEVDDKKPVWKWVNKTGTKRHRIPKRGRKRMTFRWGGEGSYHAKTKPGNPPSHSGEGKQYGGVITVRSVNHPGFKPRRFTTQLNKDMRKAYRYRMRKVILRAVKRHSG